MIRRRWELRFQDIPPGPNDRMHYHARATSARVWRQLAWSLALAHGVGPCQQVHISAVVHRQTTGRADEDNDRARLKPLVDGLVDARVVPDDTRVHVTWGAVREEPGARGVTLIIEEVVP